MCVYWSPFVGTAIIIALFIVLLWEALRLKLPQHLPFRTFWNSLLKKEEERNLSDGTFFLLGIFGASFIVKGKELGVLILILGLADLIAEMVGRTHGRVRLLNGKSLEGALAFFITSLALLWVMLTLDISKSIVVSVIITLTELFTKRDNLWIPLVGAVALVIVI
ncbi:MAG: hypothetical protein N2327_03650 [Caldimicrobium sp.]|nr:hypothetical protein [Caldimicrobium sp.]MCX7873512.1 hypothetical protein [Caldimicrobium sp.]MDW8093838.1 hypothetical protein [Caldimicrobium sp.]